MATSSGSIMQNIFGALGIGGGNNPPAPAPQPSPTNNLNTNPAPTPQNPPGNTAPNGVVPPDGEKPSPDAKFNELWQPVKKDKEQTSPEDSLTPEKMLEAASKVDFTKVLDAESLAKIKAGGDDAVQALAQLLNRTGQAVYGQSTVVAQKLAERAVAKAREEFAAEVPNLVRRHSNREALLTDNAAFKDPAVAPIVQAVQTQLEQKFPNATAEELKTLAREYFAHAAGKLNPTPVAPVDPAKKDVDWDEWFTQQAKNLG
jgi:hypothetical protein